MPVSLSIKNVPDELAERLRRRAARNRRSVQQELLMILEESVAARERMGLEELSRLVRASGFSTPSESVRMIREDRDAR